MISWPITSINRTHTRPVQTHRAKSCDQDSPHLARWLLPASRRSLSPVNLKSVYRALETLLRILRRTRRPCRGMQFSRGPPVDWGACTEPGHAEDSFSPGVQHRPPGEKGTQKTREPENHRPVRSTVNACSVPSLTIILAPCRSLARSSSDGLGRALRIAVPSLDLPWAQGTRGWPERVLLFEATFWTFWDTFLQTYDRPEPIRSCVSPCMPFIFHSFCGNFSYLRILSGLVLVYI